MCCFGFLDIDDKYLCFSASSCRSSRDDRRNHTGTRADSECYGRYWAAENVKTVDVYKCICIVVHRHEYIETSMIIEKWCCSQSRIPTGQGHSMVKSVGRVILFQCVIVELLLEDVPSSGRKGKEQGYAEGAIISISTLGVVVPTVERCL